nr:prepilin-type N-terminal cleavage/methylation domain-containing protein [Candidatus Gracilibacteria bacterium]
MKKQAFTLVELMVSISIVGILSIGILNLYGNGIQNREILNIFLNKIVGRIETVKNNSLVGKGIGTNLETPKYYKVIFSTGNYMRTYYNTGGVDILFNSLSINPFENFYTIKSIECKKTDLSNITTSNLITLTYKGTDISLTGCNNNYQKIIDLKFDYKGMESTIRLNTISGVLEKINN